MAAPEVDHAFAAAEDGERGADLAIVRGPLEIGGERFADRLEAGRGEAVDGRRHRALKPKA